jgi:hypothetical protein
VNARSLAKIARLSIDLVGAQRPPEEYVRQPAQSLLIHHLMRNAETKAALDQARQLTDLLRALHDHEQHLVHILDTVEMQADAEARLYAELQSQRTQWTTLMAQYTAAIERYSEAIERARPKV